MSPLHLEHLLGLRLLCLVMGVTHTQPGQGDTSPTTDPAVQVAHSQFWPSQVPPATNLQLCQPAHSSLSITARRSPRVRSTWTVHAGKLLGSPCGSCVTWPQTWPFPTTAVGACSSAAKLQRCMVAPCAATHAQLCTCAKQKAPVHGQSLLPQSEPYMAVHTCLGLLLH